MTTMTQPAPALLLIANHLHLIYLIERYAERSGCRVICADNVDIALDLARRERPAMLLLHLTSASDDGWASLRRLHTDLAGDDIPIAIIAAIPDEARAR